MRLAIILNLVLLLTFQPTWLHAGGGRRRCASTVSCFRALPTKSVPPRATSTSTTSQVDNSVSYTYNIVYDQGTAQQGFTQYAYNDQYAAYATLDLGAMVEGARRLAQDGTQTYGSVSTQAIQATSRVAEIQAKARVLESVAQALNDPVPQVQKIYNFHGEGVAISSDGQQALSAGGIQGVLDTRCIKCHGGGEKLEAGLNLTDWDRLTAEIQDKVRERIIHPDAEKRMPKGGDALSVGETRLLFE